MTLGIGRDITAEEKLRDVSFSSIYFVFNFMKNVAHMYWHPEFFLPILEFI